MHNDKLMDNSYNKSRKRHLQTLGGVTMGFFDVVSGSGSGSKGGMRPSPAREFLGEELYAIDCRGANLYVHEDAVVIDKTGGGLFNLGDNNFKVIPFRSIVAIQAKLKSTVLSGYIEFETANSPQSIGSDNAERQSENSVILSGTQERYDQAREALKYVFAHLK